MNLGPFITLKPVIYFTLKKKKLENTKSRIIYSRVVFSLHYNKIVATEENTPEYLWTHGTIDRTNLMVSWS